MGILDIIERAAAERVGETGRRDKSDISDKSPPFVALIALVAPSPPWNPGVPTSSRPRGGSRRLQMGNGSSPAGTSRLTP